MLAHTLTDTHAHTCTQADTQSRSRLRRGSSYKTVQNPVPLFYTEKLRWEAYMLTSKRQSNETRGQEKNNHCHCLLVTKYETEELLGEGPPNGLFST